MASEKAILTAVVTGASSGIGEGVVRKLVATKKWKVIMISRSVDKMEKIKKECVEQYKLEDSWMKIIKCDLSKPDLVASECIPQIKKCTKSVNLLLNNAGAFPILADQSKWLEHFNFNMNVMLTSPAVLIKYLSDLLAEGAKTSEEGGNVVNIGSICAHYGCFGVYSIAKAGMQSLTKTMAFDFASQKVRVNNIEPGLVGATSFGKNAGMPDAMVKGMEMFVGSVTPIGRLGTIEDVYELVLFLANNKKSGWMTGQSIAIDGGVTLNLYHKPAAKSKANDDDQKEN